MTKLKLIASVALVALIAAIATVGAGWKWAAPDRSPSRTGVVYHVAGWTWTDQAPDVSSAQGWTWD